MAVVLEDHNPAWLVKFSHIRSELQTILKDVPIISIDHVGSTSIPGLIAKPVLDIDIVVSPLSLTAARAALAKAGYEDRGEMGVPGRIAFRQPSNGPREMKRNTYVILDGCLCLKNHLDLRRMLLENEGLRQEYGDLKRRLVARGVMDINEYCMGKNEVVLKILGAAGWSEKELEDVRKANE